MRHSRFSARLSPRGLLCLSPFPLACNYPEIHGPDKWYVWMACSEVQTFLNTEHAEFYVSLCPGSEVLPIGGFLGFSLLRIFSLLERLRVPGICEGILRDLLPLPIAVVSSLKRGLWVKGPVDSLEDHCFHFIDAEAEDQRGESVSVFRALGSQARTCPTLYRALDGLPTHVCGRCMGKVGPECDS